MFELRLDEDIFEIVKRGTKRVEIRLYDEKRKKLKIGDIIIFSKEPLNEEKIKCKIKNLKTFKCFDELIDNYNIGDLAGDTSKEEIINDLNKYYPLEKQLENGVIAIEVGEL